MNRDEQIQNRQTEPAAEQELFREVQPMHQNMLVRVVVPLETLVMLGVLVPLAFVPSNRPHWSVMSVLLVITIGIPVLLFSIRLTTIVTDRRLVIRFRPFPGRSVPLGSIVSAEAIRYNALASGGWGWRISSAYHRVFNVWGDRGVHVRFGERKRDQFLVGSRDAESLAEAIELGRFGVMDPDRPIERAGGQPSPEAG